MNSEIKKSQTVRLFDVFVLGPAMMYAGSQNKLSPELETLLFLSGLGTIVYNGGNYLANERAKSNTPK